MSAEHRHFPERFEEPREDYPVVQPLHGQIWLDGHSPGYSWIVSDIEHGTVTLLLLHEGEATHGVLRWPLNRWPALIGKQALVLREARHA